MFKTNKIYNVEDLSILYNYYQEHFNQEILSNNPSLILSDEFKFYLIEVRDFIRQNAEDVYDDSPGLLEHKYIDFFQQIKNMNTKYTDIIIKNKIDVGKEGFNDIIHQKYNWDQNDREFVDSFINKYNIDVPIVYAEDMPNSLKLKLMLRDNKIYDKNLIIEEMNKIITEENLNDPNFIFNDLFMLYYLKVSKNFTNEESSNHLSYADCSKIFLDDLTQIVTQNIDISEENFKKLLAYANMKNPSVIKYINNYFTNHQNISLDNIDYNEVFPETIKEKMIQQVLENYDLFIKNNSSQIYGADQNITSFYMTMGVKNLDWLTDENDFISYLIKKREYSVNTAKQFLSKIKSKNSNFNLDVVREGTIIIEYLYDKCNRDNSFDILDVIEQSFTFDYNNEIMRLERKLVSQGMSYFEAIRTLMAINSSGTCSYAAIANSIFLAYKDNPRAFKKDFGYLMYRNIDGHKEFNYTELILDMYVYINSNKYLNGSKKGNLFVYDETGKLHVDNLITNNQIYLSGLGWQDNTIIEAFLKSKNIKLNYKRNLIKTFDPKQEVLTKNNVNEFKKTIINYLKKDENNGIVLSIISEKKELFKISKPIRLMSSIDEVYTTTTTWEEGDGHAVFITGILDDYLVVSSWGKRLLIPIKDLIGKRFSLYFNVVEGIE